MKQNLFAKRTVSMFAMLLMLTASVFAQQNYTASGTVVDDSGEPVIGASVVLKGKLVLVPLQTLMVTLNWQYPVRTVC